MAVVACSDDMLEEVLTPPAEAESSFQWTRAEDLETHQQFLRNFGLGYSYNAVRGSFCDWTDIRCQIVNRATVLQWQEQTGETLLGTDQSQRVDHSDKYNYSKRDYVANVNIRSKEEIDLGLYNGEKRTRQHFIEDGVKEVFYYTLNERISLVNSYMAEGSILSYYEDGRNNLLTLSFVNAVKHLAESGSDNKAAVDSFLNIYGTHVITQASLGGEISVDLMNYMWRYNDKSKTEEWTTEEFLNVVTGKDEHRKSAAEFKWLEHGRLNVTVSGGDQSTLEGLLGEHSADGSHFLSTSGISEWRRSLRYDPDDEQHSNVELVDMRLEPIWEFAAVIDEDVAQRIKAAVLQDIASQQQQLDEKNFFDTSFPIRYSQADCQYQQETGVWCNYSRTDGEATPMVANIVSGGRYVATVCHETINGLSLWVCYPIYEGKVNLSCGLGVSDAGTVYKVCWLNNVAILTRSNDLTAADRFYITAGGVGVLKVEGIDYAEAYALPYIELDGGIQPDGTYHSMAFDVVKTSNGFGLWAPAGSTAIVGFSPTEQEKDGMVFFRRNDDYTYIYNYNEIKN